MSHTKQTQVIPPKAVSFTEKIIQGFQKIISHHILGPLAALFLVSLLFTIGTSGTFLSWANIQTVLSLSGLLAITTLGSSSVILIGGIDLSPEGVIALSAIVCGFLVKNPKTGLDLGFFALPVAMLVGAAAGAINGLINTKLKIPSFIATLGMWFVTLGFAVIISRGETTPFLDPRLQNLANGSHFFGIPNITIIAVFLFLVLLVIQKRTALGKSIFALGGDEVLAKQAGINVTKVKIIVFALAGCLYGVSAFFIASRLNIANPRLSKGMLFPAITATVVGGTALSGGIGGALNAFIGALVVTALNNGMVLMEISPYIQGAVNGAVLILAVAITMDRQKIGMIK
ncbi:MAG: ABC transporter permease [bacterium]|nr:ABC transporter permease [bacterium]